ncbi:MAG: endolytic transglycosylase MltG [Finegoldia magna]|uniref:Endolytic transglycosylase MltG n=1 Tax=Finegoldia magna TaxID=1260 RepID=A0A233VEP2_FINMA|nr:endolytic transglycosylase MltG [Finegoldia magna]EGS34215.1 YceG-like domain protein [Finegoldia magna SY403409CC001050417]MDU5272694.1 endolytic transglycosylase MltG [Finegoldia magna]MDU5808577.1 endolytic transglycosylase MltG [Finegoldia magna]MDU5921535.1 endolytic transglycosylase MltG [Finegoldia magna]MDU5970134.1 endolytic transglycosylase MltG [Finegoldia magna]
MKNFIDTIVDFIYKFAKLLLLLLILVFTTFYVYKTIESMFSKNYTSSQTYSKDLKIQQVTEEVKDIEITIPPEAKDLDVSKILISGNIIKNEQEFLDYLKQNNVTAFKDGNYKLNKNMTTEEIVNQIKK